MRSIVVNGNGVSRRLSVEIAATAEQRQVGLMYREKMSDGAGMLFVWSADTNGGFWMKDTLIPLTIAYLDAGGRVMELRNGKPQDETILTPARPYRYVLEVNQGWFERQGMGVGAIVTIPGDLPRGDQ